LNVKIRDDDESNVTIHIAKTNKFITKALEKASGKILVYSNQGNCRAAAVILGYLMNKFQLQYDAAFALVKRKKKTVEIRESNPSTKYPNNFCLVF